jgi:hypothetical protein
VYVCVEFHASYSKCQGFSSALLTWLGVLNLVFDRIVTLFIRQKYRSLDSLHEFCSLACSALSVCSDYIFFNISCFDLFTIKEDWTKLNKSTLNNAFIKKV